MAVTSPCMRSTSIRIGRPSGTPRDGAVRMRRHEIAKAEVPSADQRWAMIESEPLPKNMAEFVRAAARAGGDKLLWKFFESGETITYKELGRRVRSLAAGLEGLGVAKGTHV